MGNRRVFVSLGLLLVLSLATPGRGTAHPLGNFNISRYTGIEVGRNAVTLRYFVDMAEIPTFQELQAHGITSDPAEPRVSRYVRDTAETLKHGLELEVGGRRMALEVRSAEVIFPEGAGGLPTMKLAILYRAFIGDSPAGPEHLSYRDDNFASRAGWKEVIAVAHSGAAIIERSVPARDRSRELSDYPTDLLDSPPQLSQAHLRFTRPTPSPVVAVLAPPASKAPAEERHSLAPPEPAIAPRANVQAASGSVFSDLIGARELTASVVAIALVVAAALGALHALEPGRGVSRRLPRNRLACRAPRPHRHGLAHGGRLSPGGRDHLRLAVRRPGASLSLDRSGVGPRHRGARALAVPSALRRP